MNTFSGINLIVCGFMSSERGNVGIDDCTRVGNEESSEMENMVTMCSEAASEKCN
jgi:hypothetical protein